MESRFKAGIPKGPEDSFYADFTIDSKWEKPIYASLSVSPNEEGKQPDAIQKLYGTRFENVTGENVLFNANGNFICIQSENSVIFN